jgi:hypothetical protein
MLRYILRRLLILIPLLLAVSIIVFLVLRMGENDPAMAYLRLSQIPPTDEALALAREQLGLNRPLAVQYLDWLGKAVRLDFGISYVTGAPVVERLLYYLPNTLYLGTVSLGITLLLSFPLGIGSVLFKDRWFDHATRALAYTGVSTPSFWLGFLLVLDLLARFRDEHGVALLLVTHDLSVIARLADQVAVMKSGAIVEAGTAKVLFHAAQHPYSRDMVAAHMSLYGDTLRRLLWPDMEKRYGTA